MSLREDVEAALAVSATADTDRATATLALLYADEIDMGMDLGKLGPQLLAVLESLLMSPRARAAVKKAVTSEQPAANPLDALADRRLRRGRPQAVDAAAP